MNNEFPLKISLQVQKVIDIIENKKMSYEQYTNLFNNTSGNETITEEEREMLIDKLVIKLRTLYPKQASRLLGNKSGKPQIFLEEVLTEITKEFDWSNNKHKWGYVKAGGDMFRKEHEGGFHLSWYISHKGIDDWNINISYKQKSVDKDPYIQVSKRLVDKNSNIEPNIKEYSIGDRLLAVQDFREHLLEHCPLK